MTIYHIRVVQAGDTIYCCLKTQTHLLFCLRNKLFPKESLLTAVSTIGSSAVHAETRNHAGLPVKLKLVSWVEDGMLLSYTEKREESSVGDILGCGGATIGRLNGGLDAALYVGEAIQHRSVTLLVRSSMVLAVHHVANGCICRTWTATTECLVPSGIALPS